MAVTPYRVVVDKPRLNILLYGSPGIGKTTLAASANEHPDLGPVLIANFEGGLLSIASRGDIDAVDIRSMKEADELFWALRNKTAGFEKYKTVVIDSGSEMYTLALEEAIREDMRKDPTKSLARGRTIDDIELQNYGRSGAQIGRIMRWFRDLPMNVIITALPKVQFAQGADQRIATPNSITPSFSAKLGVQIMGFMDFVWYMGETQEKRRYLIPEARGPYAAKTRGYQFAKALNAGGKGVYPDPWLPTIYDLLISSESGNERAEIQPVNSTPLDSAEIFPTLVNLDFEAPTVEPETTAEGVEISTV